MASCILSLFSNRALFMNDKNLPPSIYINSSTTATTAKRGAKNMIKYIKKNLIKILTFFKKKLSILNHLCHTKEKDDSNISCNDFEDLKQPPIKLKGKIMKHKLTEKEEAKGGKDSHKHMKEHEKKKEHKMEKKHHKGK
jgi:hypothetical protein